MTIPSSLETMRAITGTEEYAGGADNPIILGWRNEIAARYPEMAEYCRNYTHDAIPWCGLTIAYCMAHNGIRPVFGPGDADRFLWAQAWKHFGTGVTAPQPGDVVVFPRHVTLFERQEGDRFICRGGNQSDGVNESSYPVSACEAIRRPSTAITTKRLRHEHILATVFADDSVAYADVAMGWNERSGCALPALFSGSRPKVKVTNPANGRTVICEIIDQGPWNYTDKKRGLPGDPYWLTGTRPQAESGIDMIGRKTNGAGIDLTRPAAEALGFQVVVDKAGKALAGGGLVDWEFVGATEQIMAEPAMSTFDTRALFRFVVEHRDEARKALELATSIYNTLHVASAADVLSPPAPTQTGPTPPPPPPIALTPDPVVDIRAGILGFLGSLGLAATGVTGTMVGPDATMWGMLTPILSTAAAAMGVPAPILAIGKFLLGRRK